MAHYLAQMYGGQLLYVYGLGWHYWDGTRYALDDIGEAKRSVYTVFDALWLYARGSSKKATKLRQQIVSCESSAGVEGILKLAQAIPEFATTVDDLDIDPYLFNFANGTLDLRTLNCANMIRPIALPKSRAPPTTRRQPARGGQRSSRKCCPTRRFANICSGWSELRCWASSLSTT